MALFKSLTQLFDEMKSYDDVDERSTFDVFAVLVTKKDKKFGVFFAFWCPQGMVARNLGFFRDSL